MTRRRRRLTVAFLATLALALAGFVESLRFARDPSTVDDVIHRTPSIESGPIPPPLVAVDDLAAARACESRLDPMPDLLPARVRSSTSTTWKIAVRRDPAVVDIPLEIDVVPADRLGASSPGHGPGALANTNAFLGAGQESLEFDAVAGDWLVVRGDGVSTIVQALDAAAASSPLTLRVQAALPINGVVVSSLDGRPIPQAELIVHEPTWKSSLPAELAAWLEEIAPRVAQTDAEGRFHWLARTDQSADVACKARGFCEIAVVGVVPGEPSIRIALAPAAHLCGRVVDERHAPLRDVELAVGIVGAIPIEEKVVARTDANGSFVADTLPLTLVSLVARQDGYATTKHVLDLGRDALPDLEIVLPAESTLRGRIVDETRAPIDGANVVVGSLTDHVVVGTLVTATDGVFDMPWTAAGHRYHVSVDKEGFDPLDAGPFAAPNGAIELVLLKRGALRGRVVDDEGRPVPAFRVARVPEVAVGIYEECFWRTAEFHDVASSDGRFTLESLRRLPHRILFVADGFAPTCAAALPSPVDAPSCETLFKLSRSRRFSGRVADSNGVPLAGVRARVALPSSAGREWPLPAAACVSDGAGAFTLDVPRDSFDLLLERNDASPLFVADVDSTSSGRLFLWPRGTSVDGSVRVGSASLLASILLRVGPTRGGGFLEMRPHPDGTFHFDDVAPGPTRIDLLDEWASTEAQAQVARVRTFDLRPGVATHVEFDLTDTIVVEGRVAAPPGLVDARVDVSAERVDGTAPGETVTSSVEMDHRFVLPGLTKGTWRLAASTRAAGLGASGTSELVLDGTHSHVEAVIELAAADITVEIIDRRTRMACADGWLESAEAALVASARLLADGKGQIRVAASALRDGVWQARAPGLAPKRLPSPTNSSDVVAVELDPEARLDLLLVDAAGAPLTRAQRLRIRNAGHTLLETEIAGAASIGGLAPGDVEIHVVRTASTVDVGTRDEPALDELLWRGVLTSGERRTLRLPIDAVGELTVQALDASGQPCRAWSFVVQSSAGAFSEPLGAETDEVGRARLQLRAGSYVVSGGGLNVSVVIPPDGRETITLTLPPRE